MRIKCAFYTLFREGLAHLSLFVNYCSIGFIYSHRISFTNLVAVLASILTLLDTGLDLAGDSNLASFLDPIFLRLFAPPKSGSFSSLDDEEMKAFKAGTGTREGGGVGGVADDFFFPRFSPLSFISFLDLRFRADFFSGTSLSLAISSSASLRIEDFATGVAQARGRGRPPFGVILKNCTHQKPMIKILFCIDCYTP